MTESLRHGARLVPFDVLQANLQDARDRRLVYERRGPDGLVLYVYAEACVYEGAWDDTTVLARGLILDPAASKVVATPFPKFFNVGERGDTLPDLPFETGEKLDGSLIIIFHHAGRWRTATKGAFESAQALWAQARLDGHDLSALVPGTTYLAEAVYPENRIVVRYDEPALVLLAAYAEDGEELSPEAVEGVAASLGWRVARRYAFASISDLVAHAKTLPRSEEGFVLRFANGLRVKAKGDEYKRIHALISRVTPLAMWDAMAAGDDMETIRRELPEEFWGDFDAIVGLLEGARTGLIARVAALAAELAGLSDKEVGLRLGSLDPELRGFVFPYRNSGGDLMAGRHRQALFRAIRPTANVLAGYRPSYAMNRVMDEAG